MDNVFHVFLQDIGMEPVALHAHKIKYLIFKVENVNAQAIFLMKVQENALIVQIKAIGIMFLNRAIVARKALYIILPSKNVSVLVISQLFLIIDVPHAIMAKYSILLPEHAKNVLHPYHFL